MRTERTVEITSEKVFRDYFSQDDEKGISRSGFAKCWFSNEDDVQPLLDELKVTIRNIPLEQPAGTGKCFLTGKETSTQAVFAKAY
jgi:prolyl-tRNA synthetase